MRLCEFSGVRSWLSDHPTAADPFWQRDAFAVTEMEIALYYARSGISLRKDAVAAIDGLQSAVIAAAFKKEIVELPRAIVLHELPPEPFLVDELVHGLTKMRPARRQACLLALEHRSDPETVSNLTWRAAREIRQAEPLVTEILMAAGKARHFRLDYVFWEWATPEVATPLLELRWSIENAFGCDWTELTERYRRIIKLNRGADCASFIELADMRVHY